MTIEAILDKTTIVVTGATEVKQQLFILLLNTIFIPVYYILI